MTTEILYFPAKEQIINHLYQHPLLGESHLTDKKIIEAVADCFANTDRSLGNTKFKVLTLFHELKGELQLSEEQLKTTQINLVTALQEFSKKEHSASASSQDSEEAKEFMENILELPEKGCKQCKKELTELGLTLTPSCKDTSLLVEAKLPVSWTTSEYSFGSDTRNLVIYSNELKKINFCNKKIIF